MIFEFVYHFLDYTKKHNIIHFHNYPKYPRMNTYVKRFNRIIQEECINYHKEALSYNLDYFNQKLIQ